MTTYATSSIRSPSTSPATSSTASPTRCSRRCCAARSRRSSRKGWTPRRASSRSTARRLAQSCSIPIHLATLIPAVAQIVADLPGRADARGRHLYPQRPVLRRHASARHRGGAAGDPSRPADRAHRGDDASPGCRRHVGRLGADQCDRDLSGRACASRRSSCARPASTTTRWSRCCARMCAFPTR